MGKKYRYCVLYTQVLKQERLRDILKMRLPEDRGTVFYPCMEVYRRGAAGKRNEIVPIFPGYVFIRSDMGTDELHRFIESHRGEFGTYLREISRSERKAADELSSGEGGNTAEKLPSGEGGNAADDYILSDLREEEAAFMDFLLGADAETEGDTGKTSGGHMQGSEEAEKKSLPMEGLLRMSYGYKDGEKKYKVMEGPLRAYESHIKDVNVRDRKAYLDFEIQGRIVKAGFELKPKRFWFPEDKDSPEVLSDGTEVDLKELVRAMTNLKG